MDRALIKQHLERAEAHVAEGERHIRRQEEIIGELERDHHDTELARELLATLQQVQEAHIAGRERLANMLRQLG